MIWQNWAAAGVVALAAALGVDTLVPAARPAAALVPLAITTTPLPLNRDDPGQDSVGKLRFLGAVHLRSTDARFGGISALRAGAATESGVRLISVTDTGSWLTLTTIERGGRLISVTDGHLVPIRDPDGGTRRTKADGDAEALDWNPATGAATIAYEQDHRMVQFTGIDAARPASLAATPVRTERLTQMTGWPLNGGAEALAILAGGTRIVISERREHPDGSHAALITHAGTTREIGIIGVPGHSPTDAEALDATRILVLHRRFDLMGQGAALSLLDLAPALGPNAPAVLPARILAQWQAPVTLDNMEGLAIRRDGNRTFIYIVSDDNLSSIQRTLLMKFELLL